MKTYSVEEANALLPFLRQCLNQIHRDRREIRLLEPMVRRAQQNAIYGGGSEYGTTFALHLLRFQREAERIASTGVIVKDYDLGLCDFPHNLNGHMIYLCWKPDEDRVRWWHEIDAGFAGRQRLD